MNKRNRPAIYSRTRWVQQRTMVAQSMGFPSCFILSIRALICSRLVSFGCSIKKEKLWADGWSARYLLLSLKAHSAFPAKL